MKGALNMNSHDLLKARRSGLVYAGLALAVLACLAAGAELLAQTASAQDPRFDVVAIKRNTSGSAGAMLAVQPDGHVSVRNLPVSAIITRSYGIQAFQLAGAADWMQTERFDIDAKPADGAVVTGDAINAMLRAMLADRFKLQARHDARDSAIYELVLARSDRRLGEKLRQTSGDCIASRNGGPAPGGPPAADPALIRAGDPIPCGTIMSGGNRIAAGGETMTRLATLIAPRVQRTVVDHTGLTGLYDFDLQFQPEPPAAGATGPLRMYFVAVDVPPLMTAIQEQLGLKLQPTRGPAEYLVIDRIERPSED
jgi:uncharacterized protein (TIGR03435 family)